MKIESTVENVLTELKKRQIVFINEAHFQYEFALELAKTMNVHLEWYEKTGKKIVGVSI